MLRHAARFSQAGTTIWRHQLSPRITHLTQEVETNQRIAYDDVGFQDNGGQIIDKIIHS